MRLTLSLLVAAACFAQQPTRDEMPQEMVWVDRAGKILGRVGAVQMSIFFPEISPDGRSIAVSARDGEINDRDIWIHDIASGAKRVIASAKGNDNFPVWSPTGKQIIFTSSRSGDYDLYRKDLDTGEPEVILYKAPEPQYPRSWSPTGRWLLFAQAATSRRILLWQMGEGDPLDIFGDQDAWVEGARFSPNGLFIAYVSNVDGPFEVYVSPTRQPHKRWKVSRPLSNGWAGGGGQVRWRADGKELFYMMGNDTLLAAEVNTEGEFTSNPPKRLFALPGMKGNFPEESPWLAKYDFSADGQRFVFVRSGARR
jgi:Tol biopolymer transport system component